MVNKSIFLIGCGTALFGTLVLFGVAELVSWWVNHEWINVRNLKWWE
jgi:hypothetical protein